MADGVVLCIAVFGVGLGLIGFRRQSVLSFGIIGATSALVAAGWLIVRTASFPIGIEWPPRLGLPSSLQLNWLEALLLVLNAGLLLTATLFEKAKPSLEAPSRWHYVLGIALNLTAVMPDARTSAVAFFAVNCIAASAPPAAIVVRPLAAFLGGLSFVLSALLISNDGLIQELRLNPRLLALVGTATGFALAVAAIDVRRAFGRPDRMYSAGAVLLAVAAVWFELQSSVAGSLRVNAAIAAACATGAFLNLVWTAWVANPATTRNMALKLAGSIVRFEAAVESSLQSQNRSSDDSRPITRDTMPVSLSIYWALAAAAGLAAVAIASRSAVSGP
jgi:hypothetical protein